jgi:hypothetical protein
MKLEYLGGFAAIALLATLGSASAAPIITLSSSPLCSLGTGTADSFQPGSLPSNPCGSSQPEISSIVFAGGASTGPGTPTPSGVYTGSVKNNFTEPFLVNGINPSLANASETMTSKYLAAQPGGSVTVTYSTPQTSLAILWGSIDGSDSMNLLTDNGTPPISINGSTVCTDLGLVCTGAFNAEIDITGIEPFTTFTANDAAGQLSAFEFVPGTQLTPISEPASLAILGAFLASFGIWCGFRGRSSAKPDAI